MRNTKKSLVIDIRDQRLRDGRITISARTTSKPVFRQREAAVRALLENGDLEALDLLRQRKLRIEAVTAAVRKGTTDELVQPLAKIPRLQPLLDLVLAEVEATAEVGTLRAYEMVGRHLVAWLGEDFDVSKLTKDDASTWLYQAKETMGGEPWSAAKQALTVALCGRIWQSALERERESAEIEKRKPLFTRNVWRMVTPRGIRKKRVGYLQPAEWRTLLSRVEGTPSAAMLALGVLAGLRQQEVAHLRTDIDVDLVSRLLHVQPRDGEYAWRPKTDRSIRTLDMSDELFRILTDHVEAGFAGERFFVVPAHLDRPMTSTTIHRWTKAAFTAAGIQYGGRKGDGLTNHSLRHTFASWAIQKNVSPMVVGELLGDTVKMVINVYGHLAPRNMREAINLIGLISTESTPTSSAVSGDTVESEAVAL